MSYIGLVKNISNISYQFDYPLSNLNKYGTGGNAKLAIFPSNLEELKSVVNLVKGKYNYFIVGGGSNLLVSDSGYDGIIISTKAVNKTDIKGSLYIAECGAKIKTVIDDMANNCFSGLEFAVGIPATVGGAVAMNAGCYGKNIGDYVCYVVTENNTYNKEECQFSYRKSVFLQNGETILKVCFNTIPQEEDYIQEKLNLYKNFRKNPKGRSCGSVFKNDGFFAGKIIDEAGLKGFKVGGAKISNEHANFIIAEKGATSSDIYNLIKIVKQKVYEKKQITLNEEIIYLGEF